MFQNKEFVTRFNQNLSDVCRQLDTALKTLHDARKSGEISEEEYLFCAKRFGLIEGRELFEIFDEIYKAHPELVPQGARPWPTNNSD